ncbi:MAG: type B 50S ribosomal protein L31 [Opitutales bacterium]|nr:type B 50S ribosomal protein L31 [Opitutales bacterium]
MSKKDIHPDYHPVCFVDVSTGKKFLTYSTLTSKKTEVIDGVEYMVLVRDITSDSHAVYTGQKRVVSTASRIEKFQRKFQRRPARA